MSGSTYCQTCRVYIGNADDCIACLRAKVAELEARYEARPFVTWNEAHELIDAERARAEATEAERDRLRRELEECYARGRTSYRCAVEGERDALAVALAEAREVLAAMFQPATDAEGFAATLLRREAFIARPMPERGRALLEVVEKARRGVPWPCGCRDEGNCFGCKLDEAVRALDKKGEP